MHRDNKQAGEASCPSLCFIHVLSDPIRTKSERHPLGTRGASRFTAAWSQVCYGQRWGVNVVHLMTLVASYCILGTRCSGAEEIHIHSSHAELKDLHWEEDWSKERGA